METGSNMNNATTAFTGHCRWKRY